MKRCSASLIIKELQIKPQNSTSQLSEWLSSERQEVSVGEDVEKGDLYALLVGMYIGTYYGKQYGGFSKN